jgi:hypothetical protein
MEFQPIDLPQLVGIMMGISIPLVAVIGIVVRFALKPTLEVLLKARAETEKVSEAHVGELARLSRRVLELEQSLGSRSLAPIESFESSQNQTLALKERV